jgi:hypothetical protein
MKAATSDRLSVCGDCDVAMDAGEETNIHRRPMQLKSGLGMVITEGDWSVAPTKRRGKSPLIPLSPKGEIKKSSLFGFKSATGGKKG